MKLSQETKWNLDLKYLHFKYFMFLQNKKIFIVLGMYRILTFYVYIGEYALSINISILRPKVTIPWREISDIEIERT